MKPEERRWVYVRWVDSCLFHDQHDEHELPTPAVLESVGWLLADTPDHVTLARDVHENASSGATEGIRSACSIPRVCIKVLMVLAPAPLYEQPDEALGHLVIAEPKQPEEVEAEDEEHTLRRRWHEANDALDGFYARRQADRDAKASIRMRRR